MGKGLDNPTFRNLFHFLYNKVSIYIFCKYGVGPGPGKGVGEGYESNQLLKFP